MLSFHFTSFLDDGSLASICRNRTTQIPPRREGLQACQELGPHEEPGVDRAITEDETGEAGGSPRVLADFPEAMAMGEECGTV